MDNPKAVQSIRGIRVPMNIIEKTLQNTQRATFSVAIPHPNPEAKGFPTPNGTGFFVSKDGYFVTARHVCWKDSLGKSLHPASDIRLQKPEGAIIVNLSLVKEWPQYDLVLLKADFEKSKNTRTFEGKTGFDYIETEFNTIPEGTEVYSFGYPLSESEIYGDPAKVLVGLINWYPRTTSAIIASHYDVIGPVQFHVGFPTHYVIDKALNFGNSGGPIVVCETGKVISVCQRFQPVKIQQKVDFVSIPSLYGVSISLKNVQQELQSLLGT